MSKWCMLAVVAALVLPCSAVLADDNDGPAAIAADGGKVVVIREAGENPDSPADPVRAIQAEIQALQHQLAELKAANDSDPAPAPKADRPAKAAPDGAKTFSAADIKAAMDQVKASVTSDTWFLLRKKVAALDGRRITGHEALELLAPLKPEIGPEGWELLQKTFAVAPGQGPKADRERMYREFAERLGNAEEGDRHERGEQGQAGEGIKVIVNGQELKLNPNQPMPGPKQGGPVNAWVQVEPRPRMEMKPRGENQYGFLGVVPGGVCPPLAAQLGLHDGRGVLVEQVSEGSPAEKAGLRQYDVLTQINDQILYDITQLKKLIAAQRPGTAVRVELVREGCRQSLSATLGGTAVQSWAKQEEEECECEVGEAHEKGEGPGHSGQGPLFLFRQSGPGGGFGNGFGGFGQGFGGGPQVQVQPGCPFCPMPFGPMPGAQFGGNATFRVQPGQPGQPGMTFAIPGPHGQAGQPGQLGQPGMPLPPQVNTWLYGKPGAAPPLHKPLLHTEAFESGELKLNEVDAQQLAAFLGDLVNRLQNDQAQHANGPGPDAKYLATWIKNVADELARRGPANPQPPRVRNIQPRSEGGPRGESNNETEELKLFVNGKEFKVGPGNTVTLPPEMTAPVPPQR